MAESFRQLGGVRTDALGTTAEKKGKRDLKLLGYNPQTFGRTWDATSGRGKKEAVTRKPGAAAGLCVNRSKKFGERDSGREISGPRHRRKSKAGEKRNCIR